MIRQVLDHGFVRLVSFMQPIPEFAASSDVDGLETEFHADAPRGGQYGRMVRPNGWTGDLEIVRNARVSYNADWRAGLDEGSDAKLINSMTQRRHTSPFEAMVFTFEVKAPIFVLRQWHRHRTWSYNELSARYAEVEPEFYIPALEHVGAQHATDKQMRDNDAVNLGARNFIASLTRNGDRLAGAYADYVELGIPRELARCVLPVNVYSRMFATVDLHNLKHFLTLRQDAHAQYEIRVYADAIFDLVETVCPLSMAAFDAQRSAPKLID